MIKPNTMLRAAALTGAAASLFSATGCCDASKCAKKPNVIYILADDLGYADLGCYGQQKFETPHLDQMAENGIQFTQHYAGCTVSAPSRCALMTGRNTGNTFVRGNKGSVNADGNEYDTAIPSSEVTLAEKFKEKNYNTACIGKWGLGGPNTEGAPNAQGFDYFYGYLGQGYAHSFFPQFLHENNTMVELGGKYYSHDLIEDKAIEYITEKSKEDEPFFLYLAFTLPHAELLMPEGENAKYLGKFPETPFVKAPNGTYSSQTHPHATFAAMVERLDLSVGKINELLVELGIDENTLVIFSSDNGAHEEGGADPKFFNSTGVYRGVKRDLYEGGIRIPMIAQWTGTTPAGVVCDDMSAFWDMMPTFCELIGVDTPTTEGISILPTLLGKEQKQQHDHLYWEFHEMGGRQAVRKGDWKLVKLNVRRPKQTKYELYNIALDPSESNNVAEAEQAIVAELTEIMNNARTESAIFKL